MNYVQVETSDGNAHNDYGHDFPTLESAVSYLEENGGGTIYIFTDEDYEVEPDNAPQPTKWDAKPQIIVIDAADDEMMKITRRSRFQAVVSYTPGRATIDQCATMTVKQLVSEYRAMRQQNNNASVFVDVFRNGQRVEWNFSEFSLLADGYLDELELTKL